MRYAPMMPRHLPSMGLAAMPAGRRGIKNTEWLQLSLPASISDLFLGFILKVGDHLIYAGTALYFSTSPLRVWVKVR